MASILFLTQVLPYPLDAGPKIRAYYVLRHLVRTHDVTLLSFVREEDAPEHVAHLGSFCRQVYTVPMRRSKLKTARSALIGLTSGKPIVIERDRSPEMLALLRSLVETQRFDFVHADQTSMVQYGLHVRACTALIGQESPRLVLDAHNALYKVVERLADQTNSSVMRRLLNLEARRLRQYEGESYALFDEVVFVTAEDRGRLGLGHARTIPICGDPDAVPMTPRQSGKRCTFVGALHWPPNAEGIRWFLDQVWPAVHEQLPELTLTIIGKYPPRDIVETRQPNVEVPGYVADLQPWLAETSVWIVPLLSGGGMRVKIVDAWTWGAPVVTTRIGAEGLAFEDGVNVLIADSPQEFAGAIVSVAQDAELAERLRRAGRQTVLTHYSWRSVYTGWDVIYGHNTGSTVAERNGSVLPASRRDRSLTGT